MEKITLDGHDFYVTPAGNYMPAVASTQSLTYAQKELGMRFANDNNTAMQGEDDKAFQKGIFRFRVNKESVQYKENNGRYEIQFGLRLPTRGA